jgi:hypothetical protein
MQIETRNQKRYTNSCHIEFVLLLLIFNICIHFLQAVGWKGRKVTRKKSSNQTRSKGCRGISISKSIVLIVLCTCIFWCIFACIRYPNTRSRVRAMSILPILLNADLFPFDLFALVMKFLLVGHDSAFNRRLMMIVSKT